MIIDMTLPMLSGGVGPFKSRHGAKILPDPMDGVRRMWDRSHSPAHTLARTNIPVAQFHLSSIPTQRLTGTPNNQDVAQKSRQKRHGPSKRPWVGPSQLD